MMAQESEEVVDEVHMRLVGIDGCKSGWVIASADDGLRFELVDDLRRVFGRIDVLVAIDIPYRARRGWPSRL